MEIKEVKIGDRVRFLNANEHKIYPGVYPAVGTLGKIIALDECDGTVRVKWPKGSTSDDDIWWCDPEDIKLVDNENEIADRWSDGYNSGLNDAWEAAKTAYFMEDDDRDRYIGWRSMGDVFDELTLTQVIEGVREYEKKKKAEEEKMPVYFTGRVVCIERYTDMFTKGKIYEFKDGFTYDDFGVSTPTRHPPRPPIQNIDDLNARLRSQFIEIVE